MANNVTLMGRLTAKPELRVTPQGVAFTKFTLANELGVKKEDGSKVTYFIDCIAWRSPAEVAAKYLDKGQITVVEGELNNHVYETKEGSKRKVTEVNVRSIHFAETKRKNDNTFQYEDADLPF